MDKIITKFVANYYIDMWDVYNCMMSAKQVKIRQTIMGTFDNFDDIVIDFRAYVEKTSHFFTLIEILDEETKT